MGDQVNNIAEERDAGAFRSLFETFWPKLRAMLIRQGADRATAERIAEDALLSTWRESPSLPSGDGEIAARLYGIARNLRIDRLRGHEAWQRFSAEAGEIVSAGGGDAAAAASERRAGIEEALATLPPEQMQVIRLAFIDGLSLSAMAARLGLPPADVKSRMLQAYETLRGAMERGS